MLRIVVFCERHSIALVPICLIFLGCGLWPEMELLVPSLPGLKQRFGIQDAQVQQLLTANFFGFLLGVLIAGPLCDTLGRKVTLVSGSCAYLLCALVSALSTDFHFLTIMRFFQGITMAGPIIAGGVILVDITSGYNRLFWLSLADSLAAICMAIAPLIGTWINNNFGYQGNLWGIFILGALGIIPALLFVPESLPQKKRKPFYSPNLIHGYLMLLKDWRFICLAIPICALEAAYWIYVGVSSLFMIDYLGVPASSFGRYQGPIVAAFSLTSLVSNKISKKFGFLKCIKVSVFFMLVGCSLLFVMSILALEQAFLTTIFMMIFVGGMAPICSLLFPFSISHLPTNLQGNAQSMVQVFRLLFSAIGTLILSFTYLGPFMPVASILLGILIISILFLWQARNFLRSRLICQISPN